MRQQPEWMHWPMFDGQTLLRVSDLTTEDGALRGAGLYANYGEIVAVVGHAGPSLIGAIAGTLPIAGGEVWYSGGIVKPGIRLEGFGLCAGPVPLRGTVEGVMGEDSAPIVGAFPQLATCRGPVDGLAPHHRRMLEIGVVLAKRPRLLLLDTPCGGLEPAERAEVLDGIQRINAAYVTVVLADQAVEEVLAGVDRIYTVRDGALRRDTVEI